MPEWLERLRRIVTVEPAMFFYMTSTFIMLPAYQQLVIVKVCQELYEDPAACRDIGHDKDAEDVESRSSYILLLYMAILSSVSILPALLLGSWSDAAGRRTVMVLPFLLSILSGGVFMALSLVPSLSVYWCLLAAAITGLSGGHVSVFLSSFSYLADATTDPGAGRTLRMAMAEAMIFIGGTVGFLLGGFLEQDVGLPAAFGAYIACHVLAIFYILLWLRDPMPVTSPLGALTKDDSVQEVPEEGERGWFVLKHVRRSFRVVFRRRSGQERMKLHFLILCTFISNLVAIGEQSILLLYLMYEPREFTTAMFGLFNSARMLLLIGLGFFCIQMAVSGTMETLHTDLINVSRSMPCLRVSLKQRLLIKEHSFLIGQGFGLLGLFPLLMRCCKEMTLAKLSATFRAGSYVLLAFSTNTWMVFLVAVLSAPAGITQAVIRSLSSSIVGPDEQGAMFSFSASVEATCFIFAAILFNGLYPQTLPTFPGMPFVVMAGFCIIVLIFMQWVSEMPTTHPRLVLPD